MRILFMGTPDFAVPSLQKLLEHSYTIPAVVTAPDKPRGRGQNISFTPIKELALRQNIPVLQPDRLTDESFIAEIQKLHPDLIVVVAFRILPRAVYSIPRNGSFNLHASLLPKYRGAAPINWAIIRGEKETGVTTFFLQDAVDTGSILLQSSVPIHEDETAGELHDALALKGAELVVQTVQLIERGEAKTAVQDDSLSCPAPKIFKDTCRIDWTKSARQIHDFVRGLSPYPTAWTWHKERIIKLYRTAVVDKQATLPGVVVHRTQHTLEISTGSGVIALLEIQQEGKRRLTIEEFLRGYQISEGDSFQ